MADGIYETFTVNIDSGESKIFNTHIDINTLLWWSERPVEIRRGWQTDKVGLIEALTKLNNFLDEKTNTWCNGGSFDFPILDYSFKACGLTKKWKYWDEIDVRSISTFLDYKLPKGNTHNALEDCKHQTGHLLRLFKEMSE